MFMWSSLPRLNLRLARGRAVVGFAANRKRPSGATTLGRLLFERFCMGLHVIREHQDHFTVVPDIH
jgi:hypothetical protein